MAGQFQSDGGSGAASTEDSGLDLDGPQELLLELDGPGLHPNSVDALAFLELAAAYFGLVAAEAASSGCELRFEGIEIRDKCAAWAVPVSDGVVAKRAAMQAVRVLHGDAAPPRGGGDQVRRFHKAARTYDQPGQSIAAIMGADWKVPISVSKETRPRPMDSLENLRVKTLRVGGREPAVRFSSVLERDEFTLHAASEDLARALGNQLYREVEIQAQIERGRDGTITAGKVLSFEPVDACEDPWAAWENWYRVGTQE